MKNLNKHFSLFGVIALVAIMVSAFAACGGDESSGNGDLTPIYAYFKKKIQ